MLQQYTSVTVYVISECALPFTLPRRTNHALLALGRSTRTQRLLVCLNVGNCWARLCASMTMSLRCCGVFESASLGSASTLESHAWAIPMLFHRLYDFVTAHGGLSWSRVVTCNALARSAAHWTACFSQYNGGTYSYARSPVVCLFVLLLHSCTLQRY